MGVSTGSVYKTIISRRTIRRFKQEKIKKKLILKMINAARLSPSAANLQPLHFLTVRSSSLCDRIFPHLRWAAYIAPYGTPSIEEKPDTYIVVLVNTKRARLEYVAYDVGAAIQSILLVACSYGVGCCWMKAFDYNAIIKILNIRFPYRLDSIIAFGYPAESPKVETLNSSVKYWKDKNGILHVPKRDIASVYEIR